MDKVVDFTMEDLESCWPYRDSYLLEILNGTYKIEDARDDLRSLVGTKYDPRTETNEVTK
jgi:hypothetical protein